MKNKQFDDIIKGKLNQWETDFEAKGDWASMEKELDDLSQKDFHFDEQIAHKISQVTSSYFVQPQWSNLYQLFQQRLYRKKNVYFSKLFEVVIFALVLVTLINIPLGKPSNTPTKEQNTPALQFAYNEDMQSAQVSGIASPNIDMESSDNNFTAASHFNQANQTDVNQVSEVKLVVNEASNELKPFLQKRNKIQSSTIDQVALQHLGNGDNNFFNKNNIQLAHLDGQTLYGQAQYLDRAPTQLLAMNNNSVNELIPALIQKSNPVEWRVGLYVSNNLSDITFPKNKSRLFEEDQTFYVWSLNAGANINMKYNRLIASAGIEYSKINYDLNLSEFRGNFFTNYTKTTLTNVEYEFISVPMDIGYAIIDNAKFDLYAFTGVSLDVLSSSNYTLEVQQYDEEVNLLKTNDPSNLSRNPGQIGALNYQEGLFEERHQQKNQSTTLFSSLYPKWRMGIGIKNQFGPRFSMFANYNYQLQLYRDKGIGPNYDIINASNLNIGLQYRLG